MISQFAFSHYLPAVGFSFSLDRLEQIVDEGLGTGEDESGAAVETGNFEEARRLRSRGQKVKLCW